MNICTSLWCQTIFLQVVHEVDRPPPPPSITIFTSRWSFILQMCPKSCNFLCFTTSTIVQRLRLCLSSTLWVSSYYISFRICQEFSGICGFYCLRLGSIDQMRKDMPPADQSFFLMVNLLLLQNVFSIPNLWLARLILRFISALQSLSFDTRLPALVSNNNNYHSNNEFNEPFVGLPCRYSLGSSKRDLIFAIKLRLFIVG